MRRILVIALPLTILGVLFGYPSVLLAGWFAVPVWVTTGSTLAYLVTVISGQIVLRRQSFYNSRIVAFSWALNISIGIGATFFFYTWLVKLGGLLPHSSSEVEFNHLRACLVVGFTALTCLIGFAQARIGPRVVRVRVPLKNLPAAFEGVTIAQISDLHVSGTIRRPYVQRVVEQTLALKPDVIALTGDFADGTVEMLRQEMAPLGELKAPLGKYFITGNHEYYSGAEEWIAEHRRLGSRVLLNEHVMLNKNDSKIVLGGITDHTAGHHNPAHVPSAKVAFTGAPPNLVKILLAHQPVSYHQALAEKVDLQLSGHTHGGQWFPASLLIRLGQRYLNGLYKVRGMWLYVNSGTGYWGPPLRFLIAPEITLLTLSKE